MSDERSLLGTSLAAESSLFRHPGEVYFRATACFDLHSLYTRAFASFLESVNAARWERALRLIPTWLLVD